MQTLAVESRSSAAQSQFINRASSEAFLSCSSTLASNASADLARALSANSPSDTNSRQRMARMAAFTKWRYSRLKLLEMAAVAGQNSNISVSASLITDERVLCQSSERMGGEEFIVEVISGIPKVTSSAPKDGPDI